MLENMCARDDALWVPLPVPPPSFVKSVRVPWVVDRGDFYWACINTMQRTGWWTLGAKARTPTTVVAPSSRAGHQPEGVLRVGLDYASGFCFVAIQRARTGYAVRSTSPRALVVAVLSCLLYISRRVRYPGDGGAPILCTLVLERMARGRCFPSLRTRKRCQTVVMADTKKSAPRAGVLFSGVGGVWGKHSILISQRFCVVFGKRSDDILSVPLAAGAVSVLSGYTCLSVSCLLL